MILCRGSGCDANRLCGKVSCLQGFLSDLLLDYQECLQCICHGKVRFCDSIVIAVSLLAGYEGWPLEEQARAMSGYLFHSHLHWCR